MKIRFAVVLAVAVALAGCVSPTGSFPVVPPADTAAVATAAKVDRNQHTGVVTIENPLIMVNGTLLGDKYLIRSWIDPRSPALHNRFQIQVSAYTNGWKFLEQAYANGKPLDTLVIDRSVISCSGGCSMSEIVGINLTKADVEQFAVSGLSFQISGQRGNVTMTIPAGYFAGALQAHERAATG